MVYLNPESTVRAENIFEEACSIENMEAKFGKTLTEEANDIKRYILSRTPVLGRIPSMDEITKSFNNLPKERVYTILTNLDQVDVIYLDRNEMIMGTGKLFLKFSPINLFYSPSNSS